MKRYWIDYQESEPDLPMTFWVHRAVDLVEVWSESTRFDPPRQPPVPGKGYPVFQVEFDGFIFAFASLAEIRECIKVLEQKLLPRTYDLSAERETFMGPNSHWLSRLPAKTKRWKYRKGAVAYLRDVLADLEKTGTFGRKSGSSDA